MSGSKISIKSQIRIVAVSLCLYEEAAMETRRAVELEPEMQAIMTAWEGTVHKMEK